MKFIGLINGLDGWKGGCNPSLYTNFVINKEYNY